MHSQANICIPIEEGHNKCYYNSKDTEKKEEDEEEEQHTVLTDHRNCLN